MRPQISHPRISVCLTTYNGEEYIEEQLQSILTQLKPSDEIIISDDGSTDGTLSIIQDIDDSRIKIFRNEGRHGINGNFSNALDKATGDIIFLSDQDDVWLEGKVRECVHALDSSDLVVHDAIITDYSLNNQNKTLFSELNIKEGFIPNLIRNRFTGCCMAFRRKVLQYILPIPSSTTFFHDNWIGLLCELKGNVKFIPYKGIYFRRHLKTNSMAGKGKSLPVLKKIRSRINLSILILIRILRS